MKRIKDIGRIVYFINLFLLGIGGFLVLCTVFVTDTTMVNGLVIGKVAWFQKSILVLSGCVFFSVITTRRKILPYTSWTDILLIILAILVGVMYDFSLDPEPEKLLFGGQLFVLWFLLRYVLEQYPALCRFFLFVLVITGLFEAGWGILQLYGFKNSYHSLYSLTGSFFNPGPYSGYLACILPVSLSILLIKRRRKRNLKKSNTSEKSNIIKEGTIRIVAWLAIITIIVVLPAGMSRAAWLSAIVSCLVVFLWQGVGKEKWKAIWGRHKGTLIGGGVLLLAVAIAGAILVYNMKRDSADGRLLLWKVTAKAIAQQPFAGIEGIGLGGFPAAYAKAQADYFNTEEATTKEKRVAGCPEYAFQEYLQIGLEQGLLGLALFFLWLGSSFYRGIKHRQYGAVGGILALALFALFSYPLQLPSFWIILLFFSTIAMTNSNRPPILAEDGDNLFITLYVSVFCSMGIGFYYSQRDTEETYRQWSTARLFYNQKACDVAYKSYEELYPKLKHKPEFLFESGQCLNSMGRYREAKKPLERATHLSADPMIYYVLAKSYQAVGLYPEAEHLYLYGLSILPERIYPYYLLTKLYAEPDYYQPEKMKIAADSVLVKEPKVHSTAIKEMREEIEELIQNIDTERKEKD